MGEQQTSGDMSGPRAEKECPFCCERIDARARRCPYCRMQQTRWAIVLHPGFLAAAFAALIVGVACILAGVGLPLLRGLSGPVSAPPGLSVAESRLTVEDGARGPVVVIVGSLRNDGKADWENASLEGTVTDRQGRLVAVLDAGVSAIAAGQWRHFRMEAPALLPPDRYVDHAVRVVCARRSR